MNLGKEEVFRILELKRLLGELLWQENHPK